MPADKAKTPPRTIRPEWKKAGEMVQEWRESQRLDGVKPSQNKLDELLALELQGSDRKWGRGTWAQIESGKLHPPDRDLCAVLDTIIGRRGSGATWRALAPARLHRFDPALVDWHDSAVSEAAGGVRTDALHLVAGLHELGQAAGWAWARTVERDKAAEAVIHMAAAGDAASGTALLSDLTAVIWRLARYRSAHLTEDEAALLPPEAAARSRLVSILALNRLFASLATLPPKLLVRIIRRLATQVEEAREDFGVSVVPDDIEAKMLEWYQGGYPREQLAQALERARATADAQLDDVMRLIDEDDRQLRDALLR